MSNLNNERVKVHENSHYIGETCTIAYANKEKPDVNTFAKHDNVTMKLPRHNLEDKHVTK